MCKMVIYRKVIINHITQQIRVRFRINQLDCNKKLVLYISHNMIKSHSIKQHCPLLVKTAKYSKESLNSLSHLFL